VKSKAGIGNAVFGFQGRQLMGKACHAHQTKRGFHCLTSKVPVRAKHALKRPLSCFEKHFCCDVALLINIYLYHELVFVSIRELFCECGPRARLGRGFFGFCIWALRPFLKFFELVYFEYVIFVQYKMVVLTIVAKNNGETVYFEEPILKVHFMKLLSCSLYNSWHNIEKEGSAALGNPDNAQGLSVAKIPPGHYTLESLAKNRRPV